jgi:hypothetical protein
MVHWYITKSYTRKDKGISCAAGAWPPMSGAVGEMRSELGKKNNFLIILW